MAQHFDLIVIGSGPAGRRAAVRAAKLKKSVLVVERGRRVGGVCVHTGPRVALREPQSVLAARIYERRRPSEPT
jgi:NAD(P) transhydrogenase